MAAGWWNLKFKHDDRRTNLDLVILWALIRLPLRGSQETGLTIYCTAHVTSSAVLVPPTSAMLRIAQDISINSSIFILYRGTSQTLAVEKPFDVLNILGQKEQCDLKQLFSLLKCLCFQRPWVH